MAFNLFKKNNSSEAFYAALRKTMQNGKSKDQCACIDFLVRPIDLFKNKKGCLKGKGCLKNGAMTMDEYIEYVQKTVSDLDLKQRALNKIGLDESQISEIPPVILSGFNLRGDDVYLQGEAVDENTFRYVSNIYYVTYIFFSATQLYTYSYTLDTISDNVIEFTRDFFYTDITCITTEHEVEERILPIKGKGCIPKMKYVHANREWDTLKIVVPNDYYSFTSRTTETIEQSIQAAKAMIREKKGL